MREIRLTSCFQGVKAPSRRRPITGACGVERPHAPAERCVQATRTGAAGAASQGHRADPQPLVAHHRRLHEPSRRTGCAPRSKAPAHHRNSGCCATTRSSSFRSNTASRWRLNASTASSRCSTAGSTRSNSCASADARRRSGVAPYQRFGQTHRLLAALALDHHAPGHLLPARASPTAHREAETAKAHRG